MELHIYHKEKPKKGGSKATMAIININHKGRVGINVILQRKLHLNPKDTLLIARDCDSRNDWYLSFGTHLQEGYALRFLSKNIPSKGMASNYGKIVINEILASVNATRSASFYVALSNPKEVDGRTWYRILTANPKSIR